MTDIERAIESAKCRIYKLKTGDSLTYNHQVKAENQKKLMEVTISALEKQIPKKLTHLTECANEGYYCHACSKRLFKKEITNKHKYCYNCGQKIDYSECDEY